MFIIDVAVGFILIFYNLANLTEAGKVSVENFLLWNQKSVASLPGEDNSACALPLTARK